IMERLHGVGVDALLDEQGALAIAQAVRIIVEGAEAIAEANALGIVHRDVKPSNLFLANDPAGTAIVKVLDFGISKRVSAAGGDESASLTAPQTLLGSPQYMSPEQLRDPRSVDERTDVWGLGVTLYELLTEHPPFECDSIPELCALIFNSTPARADALRPEIPAALADVIARCLAKRPLERTPSVATLVAELLPFCSGDVAAAAEKLARSARPTRSASPVAAARTSRRGLVLLGVTAASVAVGIGLIATRGERPTALAASPSAEPAPLASPSSSSTALAPAAASAAVDAVDAPAPAAPSAAVTASSSPRVAPKAAPRPRGLKGIKLID
ncbi:MAG TPA: serine/threonine-protein kinase, partial [Labilithrix sp.]|nr:serine/threonine-protein kinase [Labilithrix sp.]